MIRRARQRRVATNALEIAINGVRRLHPDDIAVQTKLLERAVREFACGEHCPMHWGTLADAANMAETLASMGLGGGPDAEQVIDRAQQVLHDVHQRHAERGSHTLYADEIDALQWLVRLHVMQLGACSYREFATAFDRTRERIAQACAGNAPPGARLVMGMVGNEIGATP